VSALPEPITPPGGPDREDREAREARDAGLPADLLLLCGEGLEAEGEGDALRDALGATGLPVRLVPLSSLPAAPPLGAGDGETAPPEVALLACPTPATLLGGLPRARVALPSCALLAWLPRAPEGPEQALGVARAVLAAGADDLLLGVPAAGVLLTRAASTYRAARARQKERRTAAHRLALREIITTLGLGRPPVPTPEAVPALVLPAAAGVPTGIIDGPEGEREDALGGTFSHILAQVVQAIGWAHGALLLLIDDLDLLSVLATTGDGGRAQLPLRPEDLGALRAALREGRPAPLRDEEGSGDAARLRRLLRLPPQSGLLVLPLPEDPGDRGAAAPLFFVLASQGAAPPLDEDAEDFLIVSTQIAALSLRGRNVVAAVRDRTRRVHIGRYDAERRREALSHYREFFEANTDGVMVLDGGGRVLYLNRAAEQLTGYAAAGLADHPILDFMPAPRPDGFLEVVRQVIARVPMLPFDMRLTTTSGEVLSLSVSPSSVLAEHGLAVLSFRDVTERRILEYQLRGTKDFLERLIDSTVDGIVAADLRGVVLLFNQGAARMTGYTPEEVVGKLPVWRLYPEGEARRIMAQLRSGENGGVGRLIQSRRALLGKNGERVPVSLSASIVYEGGREVATVGIFSDLRERLGIEERLLKAQERLAVSEKQALIAELAGTAAHELNQPLTSVMGYAGLLRRRLATESPQHLEFLDIVLREAERMAEIVRKIGRITRYETKAYVGDSRILDLDKSAPPDPTPARGTQIGRPR
jgi:PAS domain S-box-containing protein